MMMNNFSAFSLLFIYFWCMKYMHAFNEWLNDLCHCKGAQHRAKVKTFLTFADMNLSLFITLFV